MIAVPGATPVSIPLVPMEAMEVELLDQVPPGDVQANTVVAPTHTYPAPAIEAGAGLTVTVYVREQPMGGHAKTTTPGDKATTTPDVLPITAMEGELLLHVMPVVVVVNVIDKPVHMDVGPDIGAGSGVTVTIAVTKQPVPSE